MRASPLPTAATGRYSTRERVTMLIGSRRWYVVLLGLLSIVSAVFEAVFLALLSQIAVLMANRAKHTSGANGHLSFLHIHASLHMLILVLLAVAIARTALQLPLSMLPARIAADVQAGLRRRLFDAFTRTSWGVQSREREGHLQETMTSQVMQATGGALQMTAIVTSGFTFIVLLVFAFALEPLAAAVVMGATVLVFLGLRPLNQLAAQRSRALSKAQMEYAAGVNQANRLAEETHVFGVASAQRRAVNRLIGNARELFFRTQMLARLTPAIFQSVIYLILAGGLEVLARTGTTHLVSLGAVILILLRAGNYGQSVQGAWLSLRQSLPFIERLQDTRDRYMENAPAGGRDHVERIDRLAFQHVSFSYNEDRPVLSEISFQVQGGESIGVIGPSGAGKSTLIQLLLRLRFPDQGSYLVNGIPAERIRSADWHRLIAYVPQEPRLLHATVAENIRFMREISEEDVHRAAQLARIHDDIVAWPKGYDTVVGPRADAVSGGQQQRICLARALAARPEVLILDEPTSALDPHSESLIQESLLDLRENLTLFVIAHRMSTLDICGRVMVIVGGRLVAFNTTDRLRQENAYYRSASALAAGAGGGLL